MVATVTPDPRRQLVAEIVASYRKPPCRELRILLQRAHAAGDADLDVELSKDPQWTPTADARPRLVAVKICNGETT
jgi:hypothetical protein